MQTNRCRGAGDVPAVLFELAVQVGDLKLALGLAEVRLRKQGLAGSAAPAARLIAACTAAKTSARSC